MGRSPKFVHEKDGQVSLRVTLPGSIWNVACEFAQDMGIPVDSAIRMMIRQLGHAFEAGDVSFLSTDFQAALKRVRERTFGLIDTSPDAIDLTVLHRSDRMKSGFVGVYANGKGFRAMARGKAIGTWPTAEAAAYRRFLFHKQNGLPYGELEIEMDRWRRGKNGEDPFKGTDEELIAAIRKHALGTGTHHEIFGPNEENVPKRIAKTEPPPLMSAPSPTLEPAGGVPLDIFED